MDVRFEIIRLYGIWTLTSDGPDTVKFATEAEAIAAGVAAARRHQEEGLGSATVHLWHGAHDTIVFPKADPANVTQ